MNLVDFQRKMKFSHQKSLPFKVLKHMKKYQQKCENTNLTNLNDLSEVILYRNLDQEKSFQRGQWRLAQHCYICERWSKVCFRVPSLLRHKRAIFLIEEGLNFGVRKRFHQFRKKLQTYVEQKSMGGNHYKIFDHGEGKNNDYEGCDVE